MSYTLPADVADQVQSFLASGGFASEDDVLRAALAALDDQRRSLEEIQAGIDDLNASRIRAFDEVDAELRTKYGFVQKQ